jgi:hypothetical protein
MKLTVLSVNADDENVEIFIKKNEYFKRVFQIIFSL